MTDDVGKILTLRGKSRHGKTRLAQHGNPWHVQMDGFFRGRAAWLLQSDDQTDRGFFNLRWVLKQDDPNFEVM